MNFIGSHQVLKQTMKCYIRSVHQGPNIPFLGISVPSFILFRHMRQVLELFVAKKKSFSWATPKSLQFELAVLSKPGQAAQLGEVQVVGTFTQALYKSGKNWVTSIEHLLENTGNTKQALCISSHIPVVLAGEYRAASLWMILFTIHIKLGGNTVVLSCAIYIYIYITQTTSVYCSKLTF